MVNGIVALEELRLNGISIKCGNFLKNGMGESFPNVRINKEYAIDILQ
jgi:hypothetical protein